MIADWNLLPPGAVGGTVASPAAAASTGVVGCGADEAAVAVEGLATEAEMRRKGWPGMRRKEAQSSQSFFQTPACVGLGVVVGWVLVLGWMDGGGGRVVRVVSAGSDDGSSTHRIVARSSA